MKKFKRAPPPPPPPSSSATQGPKPSKHVVHIGGIPVEFPYQPYGTQLAYMNRVIVTLDRAHRDGHSHALLESPTGTGKSLSLLCSTLAWQQNCKSKNRYSYFTHSKPDPQALVDPIGHGGGFIPETQPSGNPDTAPPAASNGTKKKKPAPTIFYASRTHSQITQVIREYRKTSYRVPMAILASRKHYCTNVNVRGQDNIDEQCKLLLKDQEAGCSEFKNAHKVKGHPSIQKGGCHEAHDIEDLVKVGQIVKGCSYFGARSLADDAELVFCPYNYIINPVVRRAMEVNIKGAIIIIDEAHNIEDICRDAGSVDVEEDILLQLQMELEQLIQSDTMIYQPLVEMTQDIRSWIARKKNTLEKHGFQHYASCWTGDKALKELQEANVTKQCFPILQECASKAIKAASEAEPGTDHLSGMAASVLEGLVSSLSYFFSGDGLHVCDYQLALQHYVKKSPGSAVGSWTQTFSLWCLNPAVVFREIADSCLSVILTSGTLSPMDSFSSELGVTFGTSLEAPHVIDVESQLCAAVISRGPRNYPLNASFKTADSYAFQDALGTSLEEICKIVPGGCLVFFPSYKLMEKLSSRWKETGQWARLNARKPIFTEPRGGQEEFESVLNGYYSSINQREKLVMGRKKKAKGSALSDGTPLEVSNENKKEGAAFLAVCRGKVSEGIDFSDEKARVVIIVGIPFPNINDIKVDLKKKFNNTYKSSKNLLSGSEWYCNQAFRALNQATGRCIRHRFDYGAVILLDERFCEARNRAYISKWLRNSIRHHSSFDKSMEELKSFFRDVKERVGKAASSIQSSVVDIEENAFVTNSIITRQKNQKFGTSDVKGLKEEENCALICQKAPLLCQSSCIDTMYNTSSTKMRIDAPHLMLNDDEDSDGRRAYIDSECDSAFSSRFSGDPLIVSHAADPQLTIVKETPATDDIIHISSPQSFSKDEYSSSTIIQASSDLSDHLANHSTTHQKTELGCKSPCLTITPQKDVYTKANMISFDVESPINSSVNSHVGKRIKRLDLSSIVHLDAEEFDTQMTKIPMHDSSTCKSRKIKDANQMIDSCSRISQLDKELEKSKSPWSSVLNNYETSVVQSNLAMYERLQIFCSLCNNPLGLPENNLFVVCSRTLSTKTHLKSLWKGQPETPGPSRHSIPILIANFSSVDQRIYERTSDNLSVQGIWCKEDGCVFKTIFCPFCVNSRHCLGVQVMASDASNVQLLNKVLLYCDCLMIKEPDASRKELSPSNNLSSDRGLSSIESFTFTPEQQNLGGWRTTKSKMRLPKRSISSSAQR
ncbi:Fanconi anemia group J protein homolog [Solanum pennellii]|uniref:Fanconi anemia group J protein homolog n=1 Tax=Solanum pennellii TaxID=28526 RepID=A0ABM1FEE3_SOLPN|nr:Fanconi anemia group J protein homolog [Solanum pennellii]